MHLEHPGRQTLFEEIKRDADVLKETFALQLELVLFRVYSRLQEYSRLPISRTFKGNKKN